MKNEMTWKSLYFYGTKVSEYGQQNGYIDYKTLASAFQAVLNNEIMAKTEAAGLGYWEQESGFIYNSEEIERLEEKIEELEEMIEEAKEKTDFIPVLSPEEIEAKKEKLEAEKEELEENQDYQPEIFQFYIVDDNGAEILKEFNEIVFYNSEIDMYLWGVTHYGTSWSYVLTDIKIDPAALEEKE